MDNSVSTLLETRIEELLQELTPREKISLLAGADIWNTVPVPRLDIPVLTMTDGPHGVRTPADPARQFGPATTFPTGIAMAASWDPELVERIGQALAEETLALGCDILLGPCVNIVRHPLAGRNFEAYSEDPYLAGRIGVAWVKGLQSKGVGASLKHFACNNQEIERDRGSSVVDERTLREIYLSQFEMVVKEADPWTVMCSYNRINGVYASENHHLLVEILKGEWGFPGVVVSDWGANHTITASVVNGLDLEMPGPAKFYGALLLDALSHWQIEESQIDEATRRMLRLILRSGRAEPGAKRPEGSVNTPEHQDLAREVAEASITLLKNKNGLLPILPDKVKTLAVIGPNADEHGLGGGGSSYVTPPYRITPLQGLRESLGGQMEIVFEKGCDNYDDLPGMRAADVRTGENGQAGLLAEYFATPDCSGVPVFSQVETRLDHFFFVKPPYAGIEDLFSIRWTGSLVVPLSGRYALGMKSTGITRVYLDGKLVVETISAAQFSPDNPVAHASASVDLVAGRSYPIRIEFAKQAGDPYNRIKPVLGYTPLPGQDERFKRAVDLARAADMVVFFGGMPENFESEGADRPHMDMPGQQNALIHAIAQVNPNLAVVLNAGSPVALPWLDEAGAVVEAYYHGQEGGRAVANVLSGAVNPSGKLTVTFPKRLEDTPAYLNYPGGRQVQYGEGIFVGYRYYDARDVAPLFPFGHGLSYTTFSYSNLKLPFLAAVGDTVRVALEVSNTGTRAGAEIVQLYVADRQSSLPRPPKELKGFQKIYLKPGETKEIAFELDRRSFAFYDPSAEKWIVEPGDFEIQLGSSSRDIRLQGNLLLQSE